MAVDEKKIAHLAELAKLEFSNTEKKELVNDLNAILVLTDKLNEVDTEGVKPLIYMLEEQTKMRKDVVVQTITKEEALKNAPDKDSDFIRTPKVLDNK